MRPAAGFRPVRRDAFWAVVPLLAAAGCARPPAVVPTAETSAGEVRPGATDRRPVAEGGPRGPLTMPPGAPGGAPPGAAGSAGTAPAAARPPQSVACQARLRQLATGLMMYVQDYDERFPPADCWAEVVSPYLPNAGVFHCHMDERATGGHPNARSYGFNRALSGRKLGKIRSPATTVMLYETTRGGSAGPAGGPADVVRPPRHNGVNNYAFVDGHVEERASVPSFGLGREDSGRGREGPLPRPGRPLGPEAERGD